MPDFTARITEELRALPSPIGAEPFTENDDGAPMWLSCLPWELLLCKIAKIVAAAAEEYYRPRVETVEQLDALPEDVVVMFARGDVATKEPTRRDGWHWFRIGCYDSGPATDLDLPATVLWSPGAGE